jgi:DNA-binding NtrC family response regulator
MAATIKQRADTMPASAGRLAPARQRAEVHAPSAFAARSQPAPVVYLSGSAADRTEVERHLASGELRVTWVEASTQVPGDLLRSALPIVVDFSRGAPVLHLVRELRHARPDALLFGVVSDERHDLAVEAVLAGMAEVFCRPLDGRRLADALAREQGEREGSVQRSRELYTFSPAMRDVKAAIGRAATVRAGLMIRGEEGSGRQVVARALHAADTSRTGRFVCVDCETTSPDRLSMDLFGVAPRPEDDLPARGLERIGRTSRLFEAVGGTLYLQNVTEMPTRLQARLARALRDREVVLAETSETVSLDVRCAIGVDAGIDVAVKEARVRDDLYRRVSATRIDVPSLGHRREDVPLLANHLLREIAGTSGSPAKVLSRPALSLLRALPWRGNAIELKALVETVVHGTSARSIGLEDVLAHVRLDAGSIVLLHGGTLRQARARFEHEYIKTVLAQHRGRITDAARALGIQRTNLYRKMRTLRVSRERGR